MKDITGIVVSAKTAKTVTVLVERLFRAPLYAKVIKSHKKFNAHDTLGAKEGERVRLVETRPLSKTKRWRVVEILGRSLPTAVLKKKNYLSAKLSRSKKVAAKEIKR